MAYTWEMMSKRPSCAGVDMVMVRCMIVKQFSVVLKVSGTILKDG